MQAALLAQKRVLISTASGSERNLNVKPARYRSRY
jgi:hypothetical protein